MNDSTHGDENDDIGDRSRTDSNGICDRGGETRREVCFSRTPPRADYVAARAGYIDYEIIADDTRSLPALIDATQNHNIDTFVHTAGLIGKRVSKPLSAGYSLNVSGAMAVAEVAKLNGVKRLIHI